MFPRERYLLKVENMLPWWYHPTAKEKYSLFPLFLRVTGSKNILQNNFILGLKWRISEAFWSIGCSRSPGKSLMRARAFAVWKVGRVKQNWCSTSICAHSSCWLFFYCSLHYWEQKETHLKRFFSLYYKGSMQHSRRKDRILENWQLFKEPLRSLFF